MLSLWYSYHYQQIIEAVSASSASDTISDSYLDQIFIQQHLEL